LLSEKTFFSKYKFWFLAIVLIFLVVLLQSFRYVTRICALDHYIQSASASISSGNIISAELPVPAIAGDLLIVVVGAYDRVTIPAPSAGTWNTAIAESGEPSQAIFYTTAVGGEQVISVNIGNVSAPVGLQVYEYSGMYTLLDNVASATGNSSEYYSGQVQTEMNNELLFAAFTSRDDGVIQKKSWDDTEGFTERENFRESVKKIAARFAAGDNYTNDLGVHDLTVIAKQQALWRGQLIAFKYISPLPQSEIAVTISDGVSDVFIGGKVTYEVSVHNHGPDEVNGVRVRLNIDPNLNDVSWTCSATAGGSCTAQGTGPLDDSSTTLPANGVITYNISGTVTGVVNQSLVARAVVELPDGIIDPGMHPNEAEDTNRITALPVLGRGRTFLYPTNASVAIESGASCSASSFVTLHLQAQNAQEFRVSNSDDMQNATWNIFAGFEHFLHWHLIEGDGLRHVYVQYKSIDGNDSDVISSVVNVDSVNKCVTINKEEMLHTVLPETKKEDVCDFDCEHLSFELYIISENSEVHNSTGEFARISDGEDSSVFVGFEESNTDLDFDDVVLKITRPTCTQFVVESLETLSRTHHAVGARVLFDGYVVQEKIIFPDSQVAVGKSAIIDVVENKLFCAKENAAIQAEFYSEHDYKGRMSAIHPSDIYAKNIKIFHDMPVHSIKLLNGSIAAVYKEDGTHQIISQSAPDMSQTGIGEEIQSVRVYQNERRLLEDFCSHSQPLLSELSVGSIGHDVEMVQTMLRCLGYLSMDYYVNGFYDIYLGDTMKRFTFEHDFAVSAKITHDVYAVLREHFDVFAYPLLQGMPVASSKTSSGPRPYEEPSCKRPIVFNNQLMRGVSSGEVKHLQKFLQCLGYFPANVRLTSYFGPITEQAVVDFQHAHSIEPRGILGVMTRDVLNEH